MKRIIKGREPLSLLEHRLKSFADYDNYPEKDELRTSLLTEQGYICCYCMQRISAERMKIEHWRSQDRYPNLQLNYNNLLGACEGGQGSPSHLQHCDTKKGNTEIKINPLDNPRNCEEAIKYLATGKIYSDHETIDRELNDVLNLNMQTLVNNRKEVLELALQQLKSEYPKGDWTVAMLTKKIQQWSNRQKDAKYKPYCQIVIYHLKKKLTRYV
ncbi:MAG: retron system putative HNH endonuclease [Scytonema sp. PMC 1069.18]|nr:retron system putative HNH endonuclease [Scytonema sp. PMC 1069.18]MEC4883630.1 retron system putative HNH endonuclease [Scytonema sp. PMC 1070.18]